MSAKSAPFESDRLRSLHEYEILDTQPESQFDALVKMASEVLQMPISLISLVDQNRQWFKAKTGLDATETPREIAFCHHAIQTPELMEVKDARRDDRFKANPLVTHEPNVIFYAGVPLVNQHGYALGTLCVIDHQPRELSDQQKRWLSTLAHQVVMLLELHHSKKEIQRRQSMTERLLAQVPGVVYTYQKFANGGSCIPYSSSEISAVYEVTSQEIEHDASILISRLHPDDHDNVIRSIDESAKNLSIWRADYRVILPKRGLRWLRGFARPQRLENGDTLWHGFISDVTSEKLLELKSNLESTWREKILEGAGHAIIATTPDGLITTFNPQAERLLGYEAHEVVNRQNPGIFHDPAEVVARTQELNREFNLKLTPGFETFVYRSSRSGPETKEWTYLSKSGERIPVRLCVTAMKQADGIVIGYLGIAEDLRVQKKLEKLIEDQRLQMIRTSKLASLGEMAAGIAHEINNPLAIISAKAQLLLNKVNRNSLTQEDAMQGLKSIEETCVRMSEIVRGLRVFSRSSEKDPYSTVLVESIVKDTLNFCQERLKSLSIRFELQIEPKITVHGSATQLSQVLLNLLNNSTDAVQKLNDQHRWIKVQAHSLGDQTEIRVSDSGSGIDPDVAERMMEPFFTTKPVGSGTGLGLSVSAGIVADHKGKLTYDDRATNTTFVMRLPKTSH